MKNQLLFWIGLFAGCITFPSKVFAQLPPDCGGSPSDVPPADNCMSACIYCVFNQFSGNTEGFVADATPPGFCSTIENDLWVGFIASSVSPVITIMPSNCTNGNGLQAALFAGCNQPPLLCQPGEQGGGNTALVLNASNLIPGKNYYLMIDGYQGDQCDFSVSVSPAASPPAMGNISPIVGTANVCPGATVSYHIPKVQGAGAYTWTSPTAGVLFNGRSSPAQFLVPEGDMVTVTFPTGITGNVQLCVQADNSCNAGPSRCRTVNVQPIPVTNLLPAFYCKHDSLPPGIKTYEFKYTSWLGCDSIVRQKITVKPPLITNIGTKYICKGNSIQICGKSINTGGAISEVCTSFQGCDSLVTGQLVVLAPHARIVPNSYVFSCKYPEITLSNSMPTSGTMIWRKLPGTVVGVTPSVKVTTFGHYTLTTTQTIGGVTCIVADSIVMNKSNTQQPGLIKITVSGQFSSATPYVQLKAKSVTSGLQYEWEGPQGFKSKQQNPYVFTPGVYTVIATDPSNGCQRTGGIKVLME